MLNVIADVVAPHAAAAAAWKGAAQWAFFKIIFEFLDDEIGVFRDNLLAGTLGWVAGVAFMLMAMWVLFHGFRIVTGRSRDSMMLLVANSLRSVLILMVATTMAFRTTDLYQMLGTEMPKEINEVVTGSRENPVESIDRSLDAMQAAMVGIDALAADNPANKHDKDRALWMTGIGVAGPSVVGGAMLLLYKIALGLFVGLAPIFIMSLLFEQTKSMFSRWVYYGIGTMFSLAVLSFMVSVSMKMVYAVATAFAAQYVAALASDSSMPDGISSMAMQQGGLGLILTVLLITSPMMAAQFFNGTLSHFSAYSGFGSIRPPDAMGHRPGSAATARSDPYNRSGSFLGSTPMVPHSQTLPHRTYMPVDDTRSSGPTGRRDSL